MAVNARSAWGQAAYALVFVGVLPVGLFLWARATRTAVALASPRSLPAGIAIAALGFFLMVAGMLALAVWGRGFPLNISPPPILVERGIYRLLPHPIYAGFTLVCIGTAVAAGSPSGFWLVAPAVALGCVALVWGYERDDLRRRFGPPTFERADALGPPTASERLAVYACVLIPWLAIYEAIAWFGMPRNPAAAPLGFELRWPVLEWTELIYASVYPGVAAAPLFAATRGDLRRFAQRGILAMALVFPLYLLVPVVSPPRPFTANGPLGRLLLWERGLDTAGAAMPSFHVVWAMIAAELYAGGRRRRRWAPWLWACGVAASCVTTGMHAILDVAAGLAVSALILQSERVWDLLRRAAERVANSWREWRIGPIRVINHGAWAGIGTFLGLAILGCFVGPGNDEAILIASTAGLVGAALWAQSIEGSPQLLRPYGFYGGLFGVMLAALAAPLFGTPVWLLLGGFSVAGPVIQSFGRLRCLVQGCCHGRPTSPEIGIVYRHPRTRVCRLAELSGVPIHPTPLYSILGNVVIEAAVLRLWLGGAFLHLIGGTYLLLSGLGRFVEEAYRGEPQTPIVARLRAYQWVAVGTILLGALLTAVGRSLPAPRPVFHWGAVATAALFGAITAVALGVDAPESNRRFSRLA